MEEISKRINLGDPDKLPESDRTDDSYLKNPGLKDQDKVSRNDEPNKEFLNEDPMEEKRAIEDTSEDRLSAAD
jgi:hypothetical protein